MAAFRLCFAREKHDALASEYQLEQVEYQEDAPADEFSASKELGAAKQYAGTR
ncbi:hypothetical protein ACIPVK_06535 [Paeniglutamicibacter sp. MACA_103]|uniref:hypothetical protein n=1 Tax=Paeniglutamicibacter sp. MACA_103 TaxID=3377337 RepID=UPI003894FA12